MIPSELIDLVKLAYDAGRFEPPGRAADQNKKDTVKAVELGLSCEHLPRELADNENLVDIHAEATKLGRLLDTLDIC